MRDRLGPRAALVERYAGLVRRTAARCYARRSVGELAFADFLQFGMVGLLEAIDRYDPDRGARFETFAGYRIEGAIVDGVHSLSEVARQVASRRERLGERGRRLAAESAAPSALERLADVAIGLALGLALEESGLYQDGEPSVPDNAYQRLEARQLARRLQALLRRLPDQERVVVSRHYLQQMRFDDIAASLGLTKGRVSQVHHAALRRLRELHAATAKVDRVV